jgi:hypothetical protein
LGFGPSKILSTSENLKERQASFCSPRNESVKRGVNTKNCYRKETDLWVEFGKETPFGRKFSSKHSVKMPTVGSTASFGRRVVLLLEEEAFGNT